VARVAVTLANDFEDSEFTVPSETLRAAGHDITIVGAKSGERLEGKRGRSTPTTDTTAEDLDPADFEALLIPGGHAPDRLRLDAAIVDFVARFWTTGKPVAAICHGPQLLIEADVVRDKKLTSWPSVRKDLENAGAHWVDQELVEDENLITSRKPEDLEAFCDALLRRL